LNIIIVRKNTARADIMCYPTPMSTRTALLIRWSVGEAARIRVEAAAERRTVIGYVLNIVMRSLPFEEMLRARSALQMAARSLYNAPVVTPGPRTTILLRCSAAEATRIRSAARQRATTISSFVMRSLRRSWDVKAAVPALL
jgi:uncharacterized protein (DUF1778 family)